MASRGDPSGATAGSGDDAGTGTTRCSPPSRKKDRAAPPDGRHLDKENHDDRPQTPYGSASSGRILSASLLETPSASEAAAMAVAELRGPDPIPSSSGGGAGGRTAARRLAPSETTFGTKRRLLRDDATEHPEEPSEPLSSGTKGQQRPGEDDKRRFRTPSPASSKPPPLRSGALGAWGGASGCNGAPRSLPNLPPLLRRSESLSVAADRRPVVTFPASEPPPATLRSSAAGRRSGCADPVAWTLWHGGTEDWRGCGPPEPKRSRAHSPPSAVRAVAPPQAARPRPRRLQPQRSCLGDCF